MIEVREAGAEDAAAITAIHNEGIAGRGATFETEPRRVEQIAARLLETERYPLLVAVAADGAILGWAGLSRYRERACYAGIAEFSIYLASSARGQGVGRTLLSALIDAARRKGFHKVVSRVFSFNQASLALCRACGFREVGIYEKHGRLDGRWLDVVVVERLIPENLSLETEPAP